MKAHENLPPAIERVAVPGGSLVASVARDGAFTDHADAFRARVDPRRFPDVDALARAFLEQRPPAWVAAAMRARDAVVGTLFGLKTSAGVPPGHRANFAGDATTSSAPVALVPGMRRGIFVSSIARRTRSCSARTTHTSTSAFRFSTNAPPMTHSSR